MKSSVGYSINVFPFDALAKVADLIEFEGPLLSHFIDGESRDILFYWVDGDVNHNRWLVWQVEKEGLYKYLAGTIPLIDIFPNTNGFVFQVDIDAKANYTNQMIVLAASIPEEYLPEPHSYFKFDVPEVYEENVSPFQYINNFRERALYFHLNPASLRFGHTVATSDAKLFLDNISKSFEHFLEYRLNNILSETVTSTKRLTLAIKEVLSLYKLRICYLKFDSFHVGVATDVLRAEEAVNNQRVTDFAKNSIQNYKDEVLDNNFSSPEDLEILQSMFPDDEIRKSIFEPLVKIINNPNTELLVSDHSDEFTKAFPVISPKAQAILAPRRPKANANETTNKKTILMTYLIAEKNENDLMLFPKETTNRVLHFVETDSFPLIFNEIQVEEHETIQFNYQLEVECSVDGDDFFVVFNPLEMTLSETSPEKIRAEFIRQFIDRYIDFVAGQTDYAEFFEKLVK